MKLKKGNEINEGTYCLRNNISIFSTKKADNIFIIYRKTQ